MAAFLTMAIFPFLESVLRLFKLGGITGSAVVVQHLTLWTGFLGAILAARENKLLALTGPHGFTEKEKPNLLYWFASVVSLSVLLSLTWASLQLVLVEARFPNNILPGVPIWLVQVIMPVGFALIAYQIYAKSSTDRVLRLIMLLIVIVMAALGVGETTPSSMIMWLGIVSLIISLVFGAPIFVGMGGIALLLFWNAGVPVTAIPAETYRIVVSPTLPTIPLFTLGGYLLAEGGASKRMIEVFQQWFGWIPGGTPVVVTLLCGSFTALTGGSGVTILALGGLLFPLLRAEKYSVPFSIGLITVSGSLGLLFPPSLPAIIYGVTAGVPINKIFIAGIIPGLLLIFLVAIWGVRQSVIKKHKRKHFNLRKAMTALWIAKWEAILPVIILGGIFSGITTLVEVAAFCVIYVLIIETLVYKDLEFNNIPQIIVDCATLVGGVLIILGVAMGLTSYLVDAQVPMHILNWVKANIDSKIVFLLSLNMFLLIVGCLMDIFSAIIVVVPLIAPIGMHFGVNPLHLAVIFIANLELGFLTPPVGMNLFLSAYRFDKTMPEVYKSTLPFFIIRLLAVLAITYLPILSLWLVGR